MKRQKDMDSFFRKVPRTEPLKQDANDDETKLILRHYSNESCTANVAEGKCEEVETLDLPDCWSIEQYMNFKEKYDGLIVRSKNVGCDICSKFYFKLVTMKGIHMSQEWVTCSVQPSGRDKKFNKLP
ncbi:uncharacterized protein LOC143242804 [Tachypleus tridentatus]|uniref:uncharacterized protein LOC143242804 n=1 Tax=Tachypleus tridentatus TaxID=6853 RepID=UPI003FD2446C